VWSPTFDFLYVIGLKREVVYGKPKQSQSTANRIVSFATEEMARSTAATGLKAAETKSTGRCTTTGLISVRLYDSGLVRLKSLMMQMAFRAS